MRTQPGFEFRVLDLPPADIITRITDAGAEYIRDCKMRRYIYQTNPGDISKQLQLSDTGCSITLSIEHDNSWARDGEDFHEIIVSSFENTHKLMTKLGFHIKAYQENLRSSWVLADVRLLIDTWPMIPPFLELAGVDYDSCYKAAKRLGFKRKQLLNDSLSMIYEGYGIDLGAIEDLRFKGDNEKPEW